MPQNNYNVNNKSNQNFQGAHRRQGEIRDKSSFSRYNKRYLNKQEFQQQYFNDMVDEFDPVRSWIPFIAFGICAALICLIWVFRVLGSHTTIMENSGYFTAGIVILIATFVASVLLVAITAHITSRKLGNMEPSDAIFTALGKTTIILIVFVALWIVCMFIVS
ncbi:MAG: hypothetical protein IKE43_04535 [Coriobacteriales bacterium]|nr:hypothetical protein [Coriobacteriales bacterium]